MLNKMKIAKFQNIKYPSLKWSMPAIGKKKNFLNSEFCSRICSLSYQRASVRFRATYRLSTPGSYRSVNAKL